MNQRRKAPREVELKRELDDPGQLPGLRDHGELSRPVDGPRAGGMARPLPAAPLSPRRAPGVPATWPGRRAV